MLIDNTYFKGDIHIAGANGSDIQSKIDLFIDKYETEYLQLILGYDFYQLFMDGLAENTVADRWTELLTGDTFTDCNGNTRKWYGLQQDVAATAVNRSPIAQYVFFYYSRHNATVTTASGEVGVRWEKSVGVSPADKQIKAWNDMVEMNRTLYDYLQYKKVNGALVYSEFSTAKVDCKADGLFTKINPLL